MRGRRCFEHESYRRGPRYTSSMRSKLAPVLCLFAFHAAACGAVVSDPPCHAGADVLPNGGFEDPMQKWAAVPGPTQLCPLSGGFPAHDTQSGCLGVNGAKVETLSQEVALPASAKALTATLTGVICIDTDETDNLPHDVLSLDLLDGQTVIAQLGRFSNQDGSHGCDFKPLQVMATLKGDPGRATLRLMATEDGGNATTFYLDDLSLAVACTP
jgi:hypothetical protein